MVEADALALREFGKARPVFGSNTSLVDGSLAPPSVVDWRDLYTTMNPAMQAGVRLAEIASASANDGILQRPTADEEAKEAKEEEEVLQVELDFATASQSAGSAIQTPPTPSELTFRGDDDHEQHENEQALSLFRRARVSNDTDLVRACSRRDWASAIQLLDPTSINDECGQWGSCLVYAILYGPLWVLKALLTAGADPLSLSGPLGGPVRAAALRGDAEKLSQLLTSAAQKVARESLDSERLWTIAVQAALEVATAEGNEDCVEETLLFKANPFKRGPSGVSPFLNAVRRFQGSITRRFLEDACHKNLLGRQEARLAEEAIGFWPYRDFNPLHKVEEDLSSLGGGDTALVHCFCEFAYGRGRIIQRWINGRLRSRGVPYESLAGRPYMAKFYISDPPDVSTSSDASDLYTLWGARTVVRGSAAGHGKAWDQNRRTANIPSVVVWQPDAQPHISGISMVE